MKKIKLVFHESYLKYDFGPDHPFRPERARLFIKKLKKYRVDHEILSPPRALDKDILLVHHPDYLQRLKQMAREGGYLAIDTPVTPSVLEAAYFSAGGSILVLREALKGHRAVNLLGGLHHAGLANASGFCLLNDHAIAVRKLQKEGLIKKAMIFDLDVHAGQGTQEIFYRDPKVFTVSIHQDPNTLYPGTGFPEQIGEGPGKGTNRNVILSPGTREKEYLAALDKMLPLAWKFKHDIMVLVLGVDTFKKDPLANIKLEIDSFRKIGERFKKFPKVGVMFAGGYSPKTPDLWFSFLKGYL